MKKDKLNALISLLDDPDDQIYEIVEKELLKENHRIIPVLEQKWESSYDETSQERIENLIQDLQFKKTRQQLKQWLVSPEHDLLEGFLLVDKFQYPDLNDKNIWFKIEKIKKEIWLELNDSLTVLEKTTVINHFLFTGYGFSINHKNFYSPQNCYLNQMLNTKKGNPFSLSLFYLILARQLGLSARFVDFPMNPLIAIVDEKLARKVHGKNSSTDILFYINPSNKGSIASRKEVKYHLKKNNYFPEEKYSEQQPDILFLRRLLESLYEAFHSVGLPGKEDRVVQLLKLF